ncbi:MAG: hypothetical protein SGARI_003822 [Bacillariaceae sp.]
MFLSVMRTSTINHTVLFHALMILAWIQVAWTFSQEYSSKGEEYLSGRVSTPEKYAAAMNMTVSQLQDRKIRHQQALDLLHQRLRDVEQLQDGGGPNKHELICRHRITHGHHPFNQNNVQKGF